MGKPKFEMYTGKNGETYFRLKAANGENILGSEGYTSKAAAENGIESVKKNSADESKFEVKETANGKYHFVLKAGNGQVIGQSQMYAEKAGAQNGCGAVARAASEAEVEDLT